MTHSEPILEAFDLGRYAPATDAWLLRHVSLGLEAGQRIVIVGPTGSGKTLLLRSLAFLDPLDAGELHWKGAAISRHTVPVFRSQVIYLHQRPSLIEGTVAENLKYPFSFAVHSGRRFDEARIGQWLQLLGRDSELPAEVESGLVGRRGADHGSHARHAVGAGSAAVGRAYGGAGSGSCAGGRAVCHAVVSGSRATADDRVGESQSAAGSAHGGSPDYDGCGKNCGRSIIRCRTST